MNDFQDTMAQEAVVFAKIFANMNVYVTLIFIFSYHILFNRDFSCSCKGNQGLDCDWYMALPTFIIAVFVTWTEKSCQKAWSLICAHPAEARTTSENASQTSGQSEGFPCCKTCWKIVCIIAWHVIKAVLVGLLWVVSVLIDGDWYVCCKNDHSPEQTRLACIKNTTFEEKADIADLKNQSRMIGLSILLGITVFSLCPPSLVRTCCSSMGCHCCKRHTLDNELVLEVEEELIPIMLREETEKRIKATLEEHVKKGQWDSGLFNSGELMAAGSDSGNSISPAECEPKAAPKDATGSLPAQSDESEAIIIVH